MPSKPSAVDSQHRTGFVLAGGGALGAYEIGVLEALTNGRWQQGRHAPVEPDILTGTSVGAYNAALLATPSNQPASAAVRRLRQVWVDRIAHIPGRQLNGVFRVRGDFFRYLTMGQTLGERLQTLARDVASDVTTLGFSSLRRALDLTWSGQPLLERTVRLIDVADFVSTAPLRDLIASTISVPDLLSPQAQSLSIITTQWDRGRPMVFSNRPMTDEDAARDASFHARLTSDNVPQAIRASVAIPGIFQPIKLGDAVFVDGGVMMNAPLLPALSQGATTLHVITLEPTPTPVPLGEAPSTFEALARVWSNMPTAAVDLSLEQARWQRRLGRIASILGEAKLPELRHRQQKTLDRFIHRYARKQHLTVHRHFPSCSVGGALGLLDFRLKSILRLIELGFSDAVHHDCKANGCIV